MTAPQADALIEDCGDYLRVTLSNPGRRNALAPAMYARLREALAQAAAQDRLGAVVLTGAEGYFCAGGDLNALATRAAMPGMNAAPGSRICTPPSAPSAPARARSSPPSKAGRPGRGCRLRWPATCWSRPRMPALPPPMSASGWCPMAG